MDADPWLMVALLGASAYFSASETAFTSLSLMQVKEFQKKNRFLGGILERAYHHPDLIITTILIGNNVVNTSLATISGIWAEETFQDVNIGVLTAVVTMALLVFGEVTPKQLAINANLFISTYSVPILWGLSWVVRPVIWVLSFINIIIKFFNKGRRRDTLTVDGLLHLVRHAQTMGLVKEYEGRMVRSVFRFSEVSARSLMTHRKDMFTLHRDTPLKEALEKFSRTGHSKAPVYDEDPEHMVGLVREKDILKTLLDNPDLGDDEPVASVMHKPVFVSEQWNVPRVLNRLRKDHATMGVVLDEYGGVAGLITVGDLVGQILGDLGVGDFAHGEGRRQEPDGSWILLGEEALYNLEEFMGVEVEGVPEGTSLAGYLEEVFRTIPEVGMSHHCELGTFEVHRVLGTRIDEVRFIPDEVEKKRQGSDK